jgi:CDP-glycerol glycerophosphotransferase (TagB/SpsB family)
VTKAERVGPVLYQESLCTYVRALLARVHIISHGLHDIPGCGSALSKETIKVRLGHGVTALKRTKGSVIRGVESKNRVFDLVPVSSAFEKAIKRSWGIDEDRIVITGLPRYDELLRKSNLHHDTSVSGAPAARILYMPTWRDWLPQSKSRFRKTEFYRQICSFLLHPVLNELLADRNVLLYVHFHIGMRQHLDSLRREVSTRSSVRLWPQGQDVQDAIAVSSLLITDYSSVAWDFLYLDKPVLFYQFDVETFEQHRGAYVDWDTLFGPVAHDADHAIALTRRFVETNFDCGEYRIPMESWQKKAFQYRDARNCERVLSAILERLSD